MAQLARYEALITQSGSKVTKQRRHILETLLKSPVDHFSAESLYEVLKKKDDSIGIATVYRTLELFESLKILRTVKIKNDGVKYYDLIDLDCQKHNHHHLICTECKSVIEVDDKMIGFEGLLHYKYGFEVTDHDLIFYGKCKQCT